MIRFSMKVISVFAIFFFLNVTFAAGCASKQQIEQGICRDVPISELDVDNFILHSEAGNYNFLKCLLKSGLNINASTSNGFTALIKAASNGNAELVKFLLQNGADINAKTTHGFTPILYAAKNGHDVVVEILIENGADVNVRNKKGLTPLMYLTRNGYINMVKKQIENSSMNYSAISMATKAFKEQNARLVKLILDHGADVNAKTSMGFTPLIFSSKDGFVKTVEHLIANGANVNLSTKFGYTPLLFSSTQFGKEKVNEILIKSGIDTKSPNQFTGLLDEIKQNHLDIIDLLISSGAKINHSSRNGLTALIISAKSGETQVVKNLINNGADIKSTLDWANKNDCFDEVKKILQENGANFS